MADTQNTGNAKNATVPQLHPSLEEYERLFGVDEDAYEQPTTTRRELWSYYLYYNGRGTSLKTLEGPTVFPNAETLTS